MKITKKIILVIGALPSSLINFRGDLLNELKASGLYVYAMASDNDNEVEAALNEMGVNYIPYPVSRNGMNAFVDLKTWLILYGVIKNLKPDIILAYTIKPIIWGGLAARLSGKVKFYALVTGLGFAFQGKSLLRRTLTFLVAWLYRLSLAKADGVIFQNSDNRNVFIEKRITVLERTAVVSGSGVNLENFSMVPFPREKLVFLCVARLLKEKGIREYALAAIIVKKKYPDVRFLLVGPKDSSPDGIAVSEINKWDSQNSLEYLGATNDVRPFIANCHVFVLPSYHEGMPRSTLEAMAMGRPVITTETTGCRETVENGVNGCKVPVGDFRALAKSMIWFVEHREKIVGMGMSSRKMVEDRFDVHKVNYEILTIMGVK